MGEYQRASPRAKTSPEKRRQEPERINQYSAIMQMASGVGNAAMANYLRSRFTGERQTDTTQPPAREPPKGNTGIPPDMQQEFEERSGFSFDDVRVHYNSDEPAKLGALAYTNGTEVHIGPGQEKHLRHELGHVVQQKAGMVEPTGKIGGQPVNEDENLEKKAENIKPFGVSAQDHILQKSHTTILQMVRIQYNNRFCTVLSGLLINPLTEAVRSAFADIGRANALHPYDMDGAQSAQTHFLGRDFSTTGGMHSEMVGINHGLTEGMLQIDDGGTFSATERMSPKYHPLGSFMTDQPHCGHCTFFLHLLGLPLTIPTTGRYNLAVNYAYPLPDSIRHSESVINRILGLTSISIENILECLVNNYDKLSEEQKGEIKANFLSGELTVGGNNCLDSFWRIVNMAIYNALRILNR